VLQDWQRLAFATEAKALLALPGVSAELDRAVSPTTCTSATWLRRGCIFKGIRKLPPATLLAVEDGQVREWRYWRCPSRSTRAFPSASGSSACARSSTVGAHADGQRRADRRLPVGRRRFERRRRLMARHSDQPIRTYAIGFEGGEAEALYNELPYARRVAELFGTSIARSSSSPMSSGLLAEAAVAHGRADVRHGLHHHLPGFRVRAPGCQGDPFRASAATSSSAATAATWAGTTPALSRCRRAFARLCACRAPAGRPAFSACSTPASGQGLSSPAPR
jgi:hypothetical protein